MMCSYDAQQVFGQGQGTGSPRTTMAADRPQQDNQRPAARINTPVQATGQSTVASPLGLPNIAGTTTSNGFKTMLGA